MITIKAHVKCLLAALLLCLVLSACGSPASSSPGSSSAPVNSGTAVSSIPTSSPDTEPENDNAAMTEAYKFALQQIAFEHIYPGGEDTGFSGDYGFIEDNLFAIYDINNDGRNELIIHFTTAPMEFNSEAVYKYDPASDSLQKLLSVYSSVTCYSNGIIKEDWAHSSELSGEEYRPYNLWKYAPVSGEYALLAEVNMWSKAVDIIDYKGDPYPDDIDAENAGTVFIITYEGITKTVSKSDYESWLAGIMENATELSIPYKPLREENIHLLGQE